MSGGPWRQVLMVLRHDQQMKKFQSIKDHNSSTFYKTQCCCSSLCRAALAERDDTGAGGDGSSELPQGEGIHGVDDPPGGEHHGVVGRAGREDVALGVAPLDDAGGKTRAPRIRDPRPSWGDLTWPR